MRVTVARKLVNCRVRALARHSGDLDGCELGRGSGRRGNPVPRDVAMLRLIDLRFVTGREKLRETNFAVYDALVGLDVLARPAAPVWKWWKLGARGCRDGLRVVLTSKSVMSTQRERR